MTHAEQPFTTERVRLTQEEFEAVCREHGFLGEYAAIAYEVTEAGSND